MSAATQPVRVLQTAPRGQYYRPELDLLRFVAFGLVFLVHGPRFATDVAAPAWQHRLMTMHTEFVSSGVYGVCLFFFLSSFLITELLLREREKTGSVHLKSFYIRRILRIWPLYYVGVAVAILVGLAIPQWHLTLEHIFELVFLVGWMGGTLDFNPFGILWSISVEELFYAVWPTLVRGGVAKIRRVCWLIVPVASVIGARPSSDTWYNPLVHFLYFATGALVAIKLHRTQWSPSAIKRVILGVAGLISLWVLHTPWYVWKSPITFALSYLIVDVGCLLLFLAIFGAPVHSALGPLVYLGQISYGLYVFHLFFIRLTTHWIVPRLPGAHYDIVRISGIYAIALTLTVGTAALSYSFFEKPFLKLKARFEYIGTRRLSG
jgi:peptidoglycan/LPS O-acetylase OafA/YrhL